jgi:FdhE protein
LPSDLQAQLEAELEALAKLAGTEGVAADHLGFCERVARSHAAARAAIRAAARADQAQTGTTPPPVRRLPRGAVAFDLETLRHLLRGLSAGIGGAAPAGDYLGILTDAAAREPELLRHLAAAVLPDHDTRSIPVLAERLGVPAAALRFLGRLLAAPFVTEARYHRGRLADVDARDLETAEAGRCPTCASPPVLAVLSRDQGCRHLSCGLCDDTWRAPRLMCAACGTRDQSRLGLLYVHETDARWIETCDACRCYLKTVDRRRLPEDYPIVQRAEDVASLYLDFMAEDAGYVRPDCSPSLLVRDPT